MGGDPETEQHFISYFSKVLLIKLRHKLRSYEAIDDILQEIFLRVFSALQRRALTTPESLGAFVNSVCNNVLAEYYRSTTRDALLLKSGSETLGLSPEQQMETMERKQRVRTVLTSLPQKDREILRLIFLEERDKDEVCRLCQVDRSYLRVLLHRAKNRFRKRLPLNSANPINSWT